MSDLSMSQFASRAAYDKALAERRESRTKHVISVSGGKDSLATLLIALERCPAGAVQAIFCDTGNEHEETYRYLEYLEQRLGIKIVRLKADFSEQIAAKRAFIANDQRRGRDKNGRKIRWSNKAKRRALAVEGQIPLAQGAILHSRIEARHRCFVSD